MRILLAMPADRLDTMFRAFADRTRLRVLHLLRGGEVCVGDLVEVIAAPQPTISRHLAYLRRAGLVEVERDANRCYYRLARPRSDFHARLLECLGCCLGEAPELRRDAKALARLRRAGRGAGGACCDPLRNPSEAQPAAMRAASRRQVT
jgi:ArsR family transcriptional regulator, arsenate/arsenite/antimonite-responsive transcriptional repressor